LRREGRREGLGRSIAVGFMCVCVCVCVCMIVSLRVEYNFHVFIYISFVVELVEALDFWVGWKRDFEGGRQ
jgi:hypothetical protein